MDLASSLSGAGFLALAIGGGSRPGLGEGVLGPGCPHRAPQSACPPYEMIDLRKDPAADLEVVSERGGCGQTDGVWSVGWGVVSEMGCGQRDGGVVRGMGCGQ